MPPAFLYRQAASCRKHRADLPAHELRAIDPPRRLPLEFQPVSRPNCSRRPNPRNADTIHSVLGGVPAGLRRSTFKTRNHNIRYASAMRSKLKFMAIRARQRCPRSRRPPLANAASASCIDSVALRGFALAPPSRYRPQSTRHRRHRSLRKACRRPSLPQPRWEKLRR